MRQCHRKHGDGWVCGYSQDRILICQFGNKGTQSCHPYLLFWEALSEQPCWAKDPPLVNSPLPYYLSCQSAEIPVDVLQVVYNGAQNVAK